MIIQDAGILLVFCDLGIILLLKWKIILHWVTFTFYNVPEDFFRSLIALVVSFKKQLKGTLLGLPTIPHQAADELQTFY